MYSFAVKTSLSPHSKDSEAFPFIPGCVEDL